MPNTPPPPQQRPKKENKLCVLEIGLIQTFEPVFLLTTTANGGLVDYAKKGTLDEKEFNEFSGHGKRGGGVRIGDKYRAKLII